MSVLSRILHGPLPPGRAEDDQPEGDDSGHAETSSGLPHQLRSDATAHSHRQRPCSTRKREDRTTHNEKRTGRTQSVCAGTVTAYIANILQSAG